MKHITLFFFISNEWMCLYLINHTIFLPREANCCFRPVPGGRPLPRFGAGVTDTGVDEVGDNANDTAPSGPYFRGLPLFLLTASADGTKAGAPKLTP